MEWGLHVWNIPSLIARQPQSHVSPLWHEKKFYVFKPDVSVARFFFFFFFHIVKTAAGINNQLSTTKPNIKQYPACVSVTSFPFYFTF